MATRNTGPRKGRSALNALATTFAVIVSLLLANVVGTRLFARADLTEDHIYKLSAVSRETVQNLPDKIHVKAFISGDLQPPLNAYGRYIADLLDEYQAASNGKLEWERIDPSAVGKNADEKEASRTELDKYKIQKIALQRVSDTKMDISSDNYLGLGFSYADQVQSIPSITQTEGLEFQITGLIRRMAALKKPKMAFAASEGELNQQQGLKILSQVLQDYDVSSAKLDQPVPDDVDLLVVAGPRQPFSDKAKYHLDQFLMRGKPVALFVDGMVVEAPRGMMIPGMEQPRIGHPNSTGLDDLLGKYGIKINSDMVLDPQNAVGLVPVNGQMRPANYPTFVAVTEDGLPSDFGLTQSIKALVLPFSSSIELVGDLKDGKTGIKATAVARTSANSWRNNGFFMFNPTEPLSPPKTDADKGPFVLGYALEGTFKSAYPNGAPGGEPGTSSPEGAALKESKAPGRLLVMASSGVISDEHLQLAQYLPVYNQDLLFALNAIDWLSGNDALIKLRAKGMGQRPFTVNPDSNIMYWRYFIQVGVPLALIGVGLLLWVLRSARRKTASV